MAEELWLDVAGEPAHLVFREPEVGPVVARAYAALRRRPATRGAWPLEVLRSPDGLYEVRHEPRGSASRSETAWGAVCSVDHLLRGRFLGLASSGRLVLHAACVARRDGRAALLLAGSGTGKSSLAAALAALGWTLLGDELVAVEGRGRLLCFPRLPELEPAMARALARRWPALRLVSGKGLRSLFVEPPPRGLPSVAAAWAARAVVFVRRDGRAPALGWEDLSGAAATLELIRASFNGGALGADALPLAAGLANAAGAKRLVFRSAVKDAEGVSRALGRLLGQAPKSRG